MDKLKNWFEKKKLDAKFSGTGPGEKLVADKNVTAPQKPSQPPSGRPRTPPQRAGPSDVSLKATEAALARISTGGRPNTGSKSGSSKSDVRQSMKLEAAAAKKELEDAQRLAQTYGEKKAVIKDGARQLEVSGVYFTCPLLGSDVKLERKAMVARIEQFLNDQIGSSDPAMAAALMIKTLNADDEAIETCISTIQKYVGNIVDHPHDEKYARIRFENKAFSEKVAALRGAVEFLLACGFVKTAIPKGDESGETETFLVMDEAKRKETEALREKFDLLTMAERIEPVLCRDVKVFEFSKRAAQFRELPDDFFAVSKDELRRQQRERQEAVEKMGMLRTAEMRKREQQRELFRYRFVLLRIRFPNDLGLQAVFWSHERCADLTTFVRSHLAEDWMPFELHTPGQSTAPGDHVTLAEAGYAPSAVLNFVPDGDFIKQARKEQVPVMFLKKDTLARLGEL